MKIDTHAHFFNLRSIPARGILRRWNVPDLLARALTKLLLSMVEEDGAARLLDADPIPADDELIPRIAADAPPEIFLDEDFIKGLAYIDELDLAEVLARVPVPPGETALVKTDGQRLMSPMSLVTLDASQLDGQLRFDLITLFLRKVRRIIKGGIGALKFLYLMTRSEAHILATYLDLYDVDLAVHHMMDLEAHYPPDPPLYDYASVQIPRIRALAEQSGGKVVVFAAFDPYRQNCQAIIESAVAQGCIGVKFYPPSGYRPSGNQDGTYDGPPARVLDERNNRLFKFCSQQGIPVFTHCTPGGFQAGEGYGLHSDPKYWRPVLERYRDLIVGFGHSGGAEGWFAENTPEGDAIFYNSFAGGCFDLMREFDNVYLDFGYLDEVSEEAQLRRISERLQTLLGATPKLGERFMYGSDWHMLYNEARSADYLRAFEELFTSDLEPYREKFFSGNARKFLRLAEHVERNAGVLSLEASSYLRGVATQV